MKESILYEPIKNWINDYLQRALKPQNIRTYVGANEFISKILIRENYSTKITNSHFFNIKIDIFSVIVKNNKIKLVLIECKKNRLSLIHLSQLVGYSRVINPVCSILLSPEGLTTGLANFLDGDSTNNLLNYGNNRKIIVARWIKSRGEVDIINCVPKGSLSPTKILTW